MKWLNYHVVIDERRGCGQEKKKNNKKTTWKSNFICFCWQFLHFWVYMCCHFTAFGQRHIKKRAWDLFIFPLKNLLRQHQKKLIQVHNEIFYMIPDSSSMFFCPRGEHPHVRQFFGRWVICLKVLPFAFRTNRRLLLPALLLHRMRRRLEIIGLKSKLIDHLWMNKRFRYFVQSCMKLSLNFWVISLKKNPDNDDIYSRNNFHIIKPWRQQHLRLI